MGWVLLVLLVAAIGAAVLASRSSKRKELERRAAELEPVKKLAFEDITALGMELQDLDEDLAGHELDKGTRADYQRALDAYESAKFSGDYMTKPEEITNVTKILDDGRYAIACVRARVAGQPLPARRPACFFDPRHGMAVEDVPYAPPGGVERDVPACELDAERVKAGADPDTRLVMVGGERVPYWQGGRAYAPYAAGYFGGFGPMEWMFMGVMFGGGFDGLGEGLGDLGGGIGDGIGEIGDGIGGMFDGFDFCASRPGRACEARDRRPVRGVLDADSSLRAMRDSSRDPVTLGWRSDPATPRRSASRVPGSSSATACSARARTGPRSPRSWPSGTACCCWTCPSTGGRRGLRTSTTSTRPTRWPPRCRTSRSRSSATRWAARSPWCWRCVIRSGSSGCASSTSRRWPTTARTPSTGTSPRCAGSTSPR